MNWFDSYPPHRILFAPELGLWLWLRTLNESQKPKKIEISYPDE